MIPQQYNSDLILGAPLYRAVFGPSSGDVFGYAINKPIWASTMKEAYLLAQSYAAANDHRLSVVSLIEG